MKKSSDPDFDRFWEQYPARIGKLKAQQAYAKAKKTARPEDILAGVARYVANKPHFAAWAHPTSWLNAGRWLDEYDAPKEQKPDMRGHYPPCRTNTECLKRVLAS